MTDKSLWDLESDIFTDYEGTIVDASFYVGDDFIKANFTIDEIDGREKPTYESFTLPPGWETLDGGETIVRISGDGKGIVKSSQWGRLLTSVAACEGAREALGENAPTDMRPWIGTRWHWEVTELGKGKPYKFTNKDGEKVEGVSKDKNYPTEFLGKDSAPGQAASNGNGKVDALSVLTSLPDPVLQSRIADLAKTASHGEWFGASYKMISEAGLDPNQYPDLVAALGGKGLYEQLGGKG